MNSEHNTYTWTDKTCTLYLYTVDFVYLVRDREGEDTHQNIVHDTVLSFGKLGHLFHFTYKYS